jgi:hypothetical protein
MILIFLQDGRGFFLGAPSGYHGMGHGGSPNEHDPFRHHHHHPQVTIKLDLFATKSHFLQRTKILLNLTQDQNYYTIWHKIEKGPRNPRSRLSQGSGKVKLESKTLK